MDARPTPRRRPTGPESCLGCLRQFLTPETWKQAHRVARRRARTAPRWAPQPLILTLLVMTWCAGDSQPERFEAAKAFLTACRPKRTRPGRTVQGFQKALARTPMPVLRAVAAGVRRRILVLLGERLESAGFIPLGCDGSRLECPRSAELEARPGRAGKPDSAPTLWLTALVHLTTGIPWAWRLGKGTADEREHLRHLLGDLPARALVVADAAFRGFDLLRAVLRAEASFLIRMSSKVWLYTAESTPLERWAEGPVYSWPQWARAEGLAPIAARLIRVRGPRHRADVWLLTDVLDPARLSAETAALLYRLRGENEGLFRTSKRTLAKVKLASRTVRLVHREAAGSLLAVQVMMAQGTLALVQSGRGDVPVSPRKVLVEIRREIAAARPGPRGAYRSRLGRATRERRERTSAKVRRPWPRRKDHKPPGPPKLLMLSEQQKQFISQGEEAA